VADGRYGALPREFFLENRVLKLILEALGGQTTWHKASLNFWDGGMGPSPENFLEKYSFEFKKIG